MTSPVGVRVQRVPDPRATKVAAKGGGKGGGSQKQLYQPTIAPNTLRSLATVRITEVLSEGPVYGGHDAPIHPFQAVYLDGSPVMDRYGNPQFTVKEGYFRAGWPDQEPIPGYAMAEAPFNVGVQLHTGSWTVRTLNTPLSAVRYIVRIQALYGQTDQGDVTQASVTYMFDLSIDGGDWYNVVTEQISGKTMSPYERAVRVQLPVGASHITMRMTRVDPEPGPMTQNLIFWGSYVEITDGLINYDNTAVAAMTIDAEQFPSPPQRGYLLDGLLLEVPSNYDSRARTYDGDWDGTFKLEWTSNPAWVLYALLTNERWGLGRYIDVTAVDKWSFYEAAVYNDELVPDGEGGTQPRWTCNCVINTRQDAYTVLNSVASSMLALLYWSNGTVFLVQDRYSGPPTRLFSPSDVESGLFDYQGADYRSRWTAAAITWNDPDDTYNAAIELVQDNQLLAEQGFRETQQTAYACTTRGQAIRFGRWLIYTNQFETETVTFRVGLENADLRPGEIIAVSDPSRVGTRLGGRLLDDDGADTLTLDASPPEIGQQPTLWTLYVTVGSAAEGEKPTVIACPVLGVIGPNRLAVSGKRPDMRPGCMWLASSAVVEPRHFRIAAVSDRGKGAYEVLATEYHEQKYDYVDRGVLIPPPPFSLFPTGPLLAPSDLTHQEYIYLDGSGTPQFGVVMTWHASPDPRVRQYTLELSGPAADYRRFVNVVGVGQDVPAMRHGKWLAVLSGFDNLGRRTQPISYVFTPIGLTEKPLPPKAVYLTPQGDLTTVTWIPTGEIDVMFWWVKWSPEIDGSATWNEATTSIARVGRDTTQINTPTRSGTIMVKAIDSLGQESDDWTAAILIDQITDRVAVAAFIEQPPWAGDMGEHWHSGGGELRLPPPMEPEEVPPGVFPGDRSVALNTAPTRLSIYSFAEDLDLGIVCQVAMVALLKGYGQYLGNVMARWVPLASGNAQPIGAGAKYTMSTWIPLAMARPLQLGLSPDWDAHVEARVSQDGETFADWFPLKSTLITGRRFQWRLVGTVFDLATTLRMQRCEVWNEVPNRIERGDDIHLDEGGHATVTYPVGFLATPSVVLTARQGLAPGGNIVVTDSDRFSFSVEHRNAAGAPVAGGSIDYMAQGYGGYAVVPGALFTRFAAARGLIHH